MDQASIELLKLNLKLASHSQGRAVLVSAGSPADKLLLLEPVRQLQRIGFGVYCSAGTHAFFAERGVASVLVNKISDRAEPNIRSLLASGQFDLVVNVRTGDPGYDERSDSGLIRSLAVERGIPLYTDPEVAAAVIRKLVDEQRIGAFRYHAGSDDEPWNLRRAFLAKVRMAGGYACHHAHFDKAYLISERNLELGQVDMQEKWYLYKHLKENYTLEDLVERIERGVGMLVDQGVTYVRTMVDADSTVKLLPMQAALEVKRRFAGRVVFEVGVQVLQGVLDRESLRWYEEACGLGDFCGGLPSRDRPLPEKHLDIVMRVAKNLGKPIDVHVDQENNPSETETAMLAEKAVEHGLEGKVFAVHAISVSALDPSAQDRVCRRLRDAGVTVIICPSAALSMRQLPMTAPLHNSIAPLAKLLEHGVNVCMGVDNVCDLFMPFCDGDMWTECRMLMESSRFYDLDAMVRIATNRCGRGHAAPADRPASAAGRS